jgi:hypothetical protein
MASTVSGPDGAQRGASETPKNPAVVRRQGPVSECYAALLLLEEVPLLDDFESEDDEDDEEEEDAEDDEVEDDEDGSEADVDGLDDAGELLDEELRLSLR